MVVAATIRQLLDAMIRNGTRLDKIHLIGHSLGAHISGFVGRDLQKIARISALGMFPILIY